METPTAKAHTQSRYNQTARVYDFMEAPIEHFLYDDWRRQIWAKVRGPKVLEAGVGTGKNIPHYPIRRTHSLARYPAGGPAAPRGAHVVEPPMPGMADGAVRYTCLLANPCAHRAPHRRKRGNRRVDY